MRTAKRRASIGTMSELGDAIKAGDADRVAELLEREPASLAGGEGNVSALLLAVYHGKPDIVRLLVERGAPVSFAEACAIGDAARVKEMVDADPDVVRSRSADGFSAAAMAIFFGHGELARWLYEHGADVNAAAENDARVAPVHAAAAVCDHETMRVLLDRGADPNARQQMDFTPLHGAASRGDIAMAEMLLAHGALRDVKSADGLTVGDMARKYSQPAFAEWFEKN